MENGTVTDCHFQGIKPSLLSLLMDLVPADEIEVGEKRYYSACLEGVDGSVAELVFDIMAEEGVVRRRKKRCRGYPICPGDFEGFSKDNTDRLENSEATFVERMRRSCEATIRPEATTNVDERAVGSAKNMIPNGEKALRFEHVQIVPADLALPAQRLNNVRCSVSVESKIG
jgi:hypothetical protein